MKNILILALFISISMFGYSQTREEINQILAENGVKQTSPRLGIGLAQKMTKTLDGLIIASSKELEDKTGVPITYLYKDGQLSILDQLEGYIVSDWSPLTNDLLVAKFKDSPNDNTNSKKLYTCNMDTWVFTPRVNETKSIFDRKYSSNFDSILYMVQVSGGKFETRKISLN